MQFLSVLFLTSTLALASHRIVTQTPDSTPLQQAVLQDAAPYVPRYYRIGTTSLNKRSLLSDYPEVNTVSSGTVSPFRIGTTVINPDPIITTQSSASKVPTFKPRHYRIGTTILKKRALLSDEASDLSALDAPHQDFKVGTTVLPSRLRQRNRGPSPYQMRPYHPYETSPYQPQSYPRSRWVSSPVSPPLIYSPLEDVSEPVAEPVETVKITSSNSE